jgi:hypothetical protein
MSVVEPVRRSPGSIWLLIGAVVLVVVLTVGGLVAWRLIGQGVPQRETQVTTYDQAVLKVFFDGAGSDVTVHAREGTTAVTVRRTLHWTDTKPTATEEWTGDTLRITYDCPDWAFVSDCGVDYSVDLPPSVAIEADISSGDISAFGPVGPVNLRTSSGDIQARGLTAAADVHTSSGDIVLEALESSTLVAESTSGDITIGYAKAPTTLKAYATSGDITVTMPRSEMTYQVRLDTTSGEHSTDIGNSDNGSGSITATSTSGDVRIRLA